MTRSMNLIAFGGTDVRKRTRLRHAVRLVAIMGIARPPNKKRLGIRQ